MTTPLTGLINFRDVGGLPVTGGARTRNGVLYRSAALGDLGEAGSSALADLGVQTIVDLRAPSERAQAPSRLAAVLDVVELPLLEGAMNPELLRRLDDARTRVPTLAELYANLAADGGAVFAQVARVVASADGGVLVHCTAGKDRTGVAVALLLDAVGAERDAILADYAATQAQLSGAWAERMLAGMARIGMPITPEIADLATSSPATAMAALLDSLDADGGTTRYLTSHGLAEHELHRLRDRLIDS